MEVKKLLREDNRIIGGVCSGISVKYSQYIWANIWAIRLLFFIVSWALGWKLGALPILIYLILWFTIPSRNKAKKTEKTRLYLFQAVGLIIGAIIGGYLGLSSTHKAYESIFAMLAGIPIGAIIGFFATRLALKNQ